MMVMAPTATLFEALRRARAPRDSGRRVPIGSGLNLGPPVAQGPRSGVAAILAGPQAAPVEGGLSEASAASREAASLTGV
jgi:hypothetical protein